MRAFVAITLHVFRRKNAAEWELARHLPLDDAERPSGAEPLGSEALVVPSVT